MEPAYRQMQQRVRTLRKDMTPAERVVWEVVRHHRCNGKRFRRQAIKGQYILDFYCASLALAVEIDGEIHGTQEQSERDQHRDDALCKEFGIRTLRLSNQFALSLTSEALSAYIRDFLTQATI